MTEIKKLYRSNINKKLGGVCGGLETFFKVDATIFRVLFVVFAFAGGSGILAYVLLWILVPVNPNQSV